MSIRTNNAAHLTVRVFQQIEETLTLSEQDTEKVFSLLENPPAPNKFLKDAAAKHKAFFAETL